MSESSKSDSSLPETLEEARQALIAGDKAAQQESPDLPAAREAYQKTISLLTADGVSLPPQGSYLLAGAHMNLGNIHAASNSQESIGQAIESYENAIEYFNRLSPTGNERFKNDFAALWANLAQLKMRLQSKDGMIQAIDCFKHAIEILVTLPWEDVQAVRIQLIGMWLNVGNTQQMLRDAEQSQNALDSFDKALDLAKDIPTDDSQVSTLISTLWLNRGNILRAQGEEASIELALKSYESSIAILEKQDRKKLQQLAVIFANANANRASILAFKQNDADLLAQACSSAQLAIDEIGEDERRHPVPAEICLNARQAICQVSCIKLSKNLSEEDSESQYENATDTIDDCLAVIRFWEDKGISNFRPMARKLFRLGAQLLTVRQPHFLAEYVLENLNTGGSKETLATDPECLKIGHAALGSGIEALKAHLSKTEGDETLATSNLITDLQDALDKIGSPPESEQ